MVFTTAQESLKAAEQVKDYLYPEDLVEEESNEELIQEILRSNFLAQ
jgi:GTPase Era involved in 16S rRNA processing